MSPPSPPSDAAAGRGPLRGKQVLLCVTGGIAAYKSAYLTRALVKSGARVIVAMTEAAQRFVAPLTFETLSGHAVVTNTFQRAHALGAVEHVDLAEWAEFVLVAPATYNFLGKLHAGIADDAVTTILCAATCPVFIAPAMNDRMWRNPINQRNVQALRALGYRFVDPERGGLACSWVGEGRMRDPETILEAVCAELRLLPPSGTPDARVAEASSGTGAASAARAGSARGSWTLAGRTVLVTAAGTREAIDPVRFLGNRSSGKMGYALAARAAARGARTLLVSGPSDLPAPAGVAELRRVETAEEMLQAVRAWLPRSEVLIMAAAVADYRPASVAPKKLKRADGKLRLDLEPTPDILVELHPAKGGRLFVGFALESEDPEEQARAKLATKGLDLIVANRVGPGTGPDADTNKVWIYDERGLVLETAVLDKGSIAEAVLEAVEGELARREAHADA